MHHKCNFLLPAAGFMYLWTKRKILEGESKTNSISKNSLIVSLGPIPWLRYGKGTGALMELAKTYHGWKEPWNHALQSWIYHWALYPGLKKQKLQLFLLELSMKNEVLCSSGTNYMPVTVLQSDDIKMRKLDPQRCWSLKENLWEKKRVLMEESELNDLAVLTMLYCLTLSSVVLETPFSTPQGISGTSLLNHEQNANLLIYKDKYCCTLTPKFN